MWNDYQNLFQSLNGWSLRWYNLSILLLDIPSACPRYLYISHLQVQVARIPGAGNSRWQVARGIGNKARRASELLVQSMTGLGICGTLGGGLTIPTIITDTRERMQHVGKAQRAGLAGQSFNRRPPNITISPNISWGSSWPWQAGDRSNVHKEHSKLKDRQKDSITPN